MMTSAIADTRRNQERVWQAYRAELHRFVRARVRDEAAAEDVVHDVLVRAFERRDQLKDHRRLRGWLFQITRHATIDHYRARKPQEPYEEDGGAVPAEAAAALTEDEAPAERELARCLQPLIQALPPAYREAVTLSEIEGRTQRETAEVLGLSLSGAKSRVQRARRMLEDMLLACCQVELDGRGGIVEYEPRQPCTACGDGSPDATPCTPSANA